VRGDFQLSTPTYDTAQVRDLLRKTCEKAGSVAKWATENKFSCNFIYDVIKGVRPVSPRLAESLGLERQTVVRFCKRAA